MLKYNEDKHIEESVNISFTYKTSYGTNFGLSIGGERPKKIYELYKFESILEIKYLLLELTDMLYKIKSENNSNLLSKW